MAHNRKMLDTQENKKLVCNCKKQHCLVNGSCLIKNVIYKANFTTENQIKLYVGSTGLTFKKSIYKTQVQLSGMKNTVMRQLYHNTFVN